MTTNASHALCLHPATKAARAACRKVRASHIAAWTAERDRILTSYFTNVGSCEELGAEIDRLGRDSGNDDIKAAARGYYEEDLDMEEIIALVNRARF